MELARASMLGRELPLALRNHRLKHLTDFFDDSVDMTTNIPDVENLSKPMKFIGKQAVFNVFEINPTRTTPEITSVLVSRNAIVVMQNMPKTSGRNAGLAPRVDTFHINALGKIDRVDSVIGDQVVLMESR
jgi:hypothetical protein